MRMRQGARRYLSLWTVLAVLLAAPMAAGAVDPVAEVQFAAPVFNTGLGSNYIVLHNNSEIEAKARISFYPVVGGSAIELTGSSPTTHTYDELVLAPKDSTLIDLATDLNVPSSTVGAYVIEMIPNNGDAFTVDPAFITIDGSMVTTDLEDSAYLPVHAPAAQPVGPLYRTVVDTVPDPDVVQLQAVLELFNSSASALTVAVDFYEENSSTVLTTYIVTIPAQRLDLVTLADSSAGNGTFGSGRPINKTGFFKVYEYDSGTSTRSAAPADLITGAHLTAVGSPGDQYFADVQEPDSSIGLAMPYFIVERGAHGTPGAGAILWDTAIALVNTGPDSVTAEFDFTTGVGSTVTDLTLEPNKVKVFNLSDVGVSPDNSTTIAGGLTITITDTGGADTTQVSGLAYLLNLGISPSNHSYVPLRRPATGNVGTYYSADSSSGSDTYLQLINTHDESVTVTLTFIPTTGATVDYELSALAANTSTTVSFAALFDALGGSAPAATGSFTLSYSDTTTAGEIQSSGTLVIPSQDPYDTRIEYLWIDLEPGVTVQLKMYRVQSNNMPRTSVPRAEHIAPGVGIRYNNDNDDNANGVDKGQNHVVGEDDLNELLLIAELAPAGHKYILERSSDKIKVWEHKEKGVGKEIAFDANGEHEINFTVEPKTLWVEAVDTFTLADNITVTLTLRHALTEIVVESDTIKLFTFKSIVVALSGWTESSEENPGPGTKRLALKLYKAGYDVNAYDWDDENLGLDEFKKAVDREQTTRGIIGHSYGGGNTHDLAKQVKDEKLAGVPPGLPNGYCKYTAYIDAIIDVVGTWSSETTRPPQSQWHENCYQTNGVIDGEDMGGDADDNTDFTATTTHTTIAYNAAVHAEIINQLKVEMPNR